MTSKRPLLIPNKRALLSPTAHTHYDHKHVYKVLNPSATSATTQMKPPLDENNEEITGLPKEKPTRIEFSFASSPQPFLDPPTWEAMLKRAQSTGATASMGEHENANASNSTRRRGEYLSDSLGPETPDQQRIRREREAEYGSMAIRGRSSVSGRGKRTRASERGYWAGRY